MESYGEWAVNVLGSYGNCNVTNTVTLYIGVIKQFFITISDKHRNRNSPAVNIKESSVVNIKES